MNQKENGTNLSLKISTDTEKELWALPLSLLLTLSRYLLVMKELLTYVLDQFAQCCISYKNQSLVLFGKSIDWFLYVMQHWVEMG